MGYFERNLNSWLEKTLITRPLVYLNGPRQCGKSTLAENLLLKTNGQSNYFNLGSPVTLVSAKEDPAKFIQSQSRDKLTIIDEVQMAPEIFPYLKMEIDKCRLKGHGTELFLLTGSANLMALPRLAEALVGRMSILTLLPFSSAEFTQSGINFISRLFEDKQEAGSFKPYKLLDIISNSSFPEPVLNSDIEKSKWYDDYLNTLLQRDIQTVADIRNPTKIISLLSIMTMRAGRLLNNSLTSQEAGLDIKTYERYKTAAINTFIIFEVPAWSKPTQLNKRFTKSSKLFFTDTNLLTHLLRRDLNDIYKNDSTSMGHIFENFIATEIMKNISCLVGYEVSHFRTSDNKEVDFVIEKGRELIGIEVKLNSTVDNHDFAGLKILKEAAGSRFKKGIVIYTGNEMLPFGKNFWAVPVCYLWE